MWRDEKGSILVTVLLFMLALSILGAALMATSSTEIKETVRQERKMQAYYLARSGAGAVAAWIIANPASVEDLIGQTSEPVHLGEGRFEVSVSGTPGEVIHIEATGFAGDFSETVTVVLEPAAVGTPWSVQFEHALLTMNRISLTGSASLEGPVATNRGHVSFGGGSGSRIFGPLYLGPGASVSNPGRVNGGVFNYDEEIIFPPAPPFPGLPEFPQFPAIPEYPEPERAGAVNRGTLNIGSAGFVWNSAEQGTFVSYDRINFNSSNATLTFNLHQDTTVWVNGLTENSGNSIRVSGAGRLFLIVESNLNGSSSFNQGGSPEQLVVFARGSSVSRQWQSQFSGSLYAPSASVTLGSEASFTGKIVTGGTSIALGSRSSFNGSLYAHRTGVTITTGDRANLTGKIVAGGSVTIGTANFLAGSIYANSPLATVTASNNTNIRGDIVTGGIRVNMSGAELTGAIYAANTNAEIVFSGNRPLSADVITNVYTKGPLVELNTAHLRGDIYAAHETALFRLGGSSTFTGTLFTNGTEVDVFGNASVNGLIHAPNSQAVIEFRGSADITGGNIVTAGKRVALIGAAKALRGAIFAPAAHVDLQGSSRVIGAVIADHFDGGSGNRHAVQYLPVDPAVFSALLSGGGAGSLTGYRIQQWQ